MQPWNKNVISKLSALMFESSEVGSYNKKEQNEKGNELFFFTNSRSLPLRIQALFSATASIPAERRESEGRGQTTTLKAGMRWKMKGMWN